MLYAHINSTLEGGSSGHTGQSEINLVAMSGRSIV